MAELTQAEAIRRVLETARTIAVLGAHARPGVPAHYVPAYWARHGYRVLPVNPVFAGEMLWGERVRRTLAEIDVPVDVVDVFRRSEHVPLHLDDILAMRPRPKVVWLQLGIRNDAVVAKLDEAGIDVVQNRCTLIEHRRLGARDAHG